MVQPGDRVGERYEVIEQIAEGGMGTLWRARHTELGVDVALKLISPRAANAISIKRFKREAQAAARLRSPNIVQVFDFGIHAEQPYLAMELLRGEDLAALLAREGKLSVERCASIVAGLAKGVSLAHEAGIIHRDLKPANIFLETVAGDEVVKILDFGVAKDLRSEGESGNTSLGGVVGSPSYMSPEQVWAEQIDARTDVWAMGVVVFEMLTGENPFADETLAKVFERIVRHPLPKASGLNALLTPTFDTFFEHALARSPAERIASAREFAEEFQLAVAGETQSKSALAKGARVKARTAITRPPGGPDSGERPGARPGSALWWGLAAGLLVATVVGLLLRGQTPAPVAKTASELVSGDPSATAVRVLPPLPTPAATSSASQGDAFPVGQPSAAPRARPPSSKRVPAAPSAPAQPAAETSSAGALDRRFGIPVAH